MATYFITLAERDVPTLTQELERLGLGPVAGDVKNGGERMVIVDDVSPEAIAAIRARLPTARCVEDFPIEMIW
jgi:hypothetical protein